MFDILIIGGGHAGSEAAYFASQYKNLKIGLISLSKLGLGSTPCNPSIGGVGKGQVVRELDALGGLMPQAADMAGIQYRTLNESKGYAVRSTRVQVDKDLYPRAVETILRSAKNLQLIEDEVISFDKVDSSFVIKGRCSTWNTKKLIITTGTFLKGKLYTGAVVKEGGRIDKSAIPTNLDNNLIPTSGRRFKTGTPPRIDKKSVNYKLLEIQPSDDETINFHSLSDGKRAVKQVDCYITHTNCRTMQLIRDNKEQSPLYNGSISGTGARYCPSIEDKAYRYPDKDIHHVFLEPEGLEAQTLYPSGISTSLPEAVQIELVQSIQGMENALITQAGYAVEYDVVDTSKLDSSLQVIDCDGLYTAGQINGTSGYEEAAAQGAVVAINAANSLSGKESVVFGRHDSFIGVLIQDLISNVRDEPYRLFSSRAENRLLLREDNAILRMSHYRTQMELSTDRDKFNANYIQTHTAVEASLKEHFISPEHPVLKELGLKIQQRCSVWQSLALSSGDPIRLLDAFLEHFKINVPRGTLINLAIDAKYEGYIAKSSRLDQQLMARQSKSIDYKQLLESKNISFECKQRIEAVKPTSFDQLVRIEGIRQSTIAVVASQI